VEERSELRSLAEKLLKKQLCDNCMGRQMAMVSTGMTNRERGRVLRRIFKVEKESKCSMCRGLFKDMNRLALKVFRKLGRIEFNTFVVGSKINQKLISREDSLWKSVGIKYSESLKAEFNRELGKLIWKKTGKRADEKNPNVTVIINTERDEIEAGINPLFVYGKYKKLVRGIPQTKWEKYAETIEDIIAKPFMKFTKGSGHALHGSGREDVDARCLDWRPFVFEVFEPLKRNLDLDRIRKEINKTGKVKVSNLRYSDKKEVIKIKSIRPDKTYRILVGFEKPVKAGELKKLRTLAGIIEQKTPLRVLHRRADLMRKRRVKSIKWKRISNKKIEIEIRGEAGLYVKELVTGNRERTKPNVAALLKTPAKVLELDVIRIWL
jgi:tRNA pseudouridine synthase 10